MTPSEQDELEQEIKQTMLDFMQLNIEVLKVLRDAIEKERNHGQEEDGEAQEERSQPPV